MDCPCPETHCLHQSHQLHHTAASCRFRAAHRFGTVLSIKIGQAIVAEELPVTKQKPTPKPTAPTASPDPKALGNGHAYYPIRKPTGGMEDRLIQNLIGCLPG